MVLGDGHDVAGARGLEQRRPLPGVELLGPEHGDEVLVAETRLRPPGFDVVPEGRLVLLVHVPGIPLVAESGYGVDAPMDEDPELRVLVPRRHLELRERGPGRSERPAGGHGLHAANGLGDAGVLRE